MPCTTPGKAYAQGSPWDAQGTQEGGSSNIVNYCQQIVKHPQGDTPDQDLALAGVTIELILDPEHSQELANMVHRCAIWAHFRPRTQPRTASAGVPQSTVWAHFGPKSPKNWPRQGLNMYTVSSPYTQAHLQPRHQHKHPALAHIFSTPFGSAPKNWFCWKIWKNWKHWNISNFDFGEVLNF